MEQKLIKDLCVLFLHYIFYKKNLSKHTLRAYENDLREFFNLDKIKVLSLKTPRPVKIKNKKSLENYIKESIESRVSYSKNLSSTSKGRKLAAMRSFIRWLAENKYIKEDFRHLFKSPKATVKIPNFLSVDEIFFIVALLEKNKRAGKKDIDRDMSLFFLLYGGGLRVSEACHLKTKNINWKNQTIKIKGKGGEERLIVMPKKAMKFLKNLENNSSYFFGKQALLERKAYNIIRGLGEEAGLLKPLHPHALRHSFATHLLSSGSDLRVLQDLLGHKTLMATQKYTHLDLSHLSQTLEKFHPIYQLKTN